MLLGIVFLVAHGVFLHGIGLYFDISFKYCVTLARTSGFSDLATLTSENTFFESPSAFIFTHFHCVSSTSFQVSFVIRFV